MRVALFLIAASLSILPAISKHYPPSSSTSYRPSSPSPPHRAPSPPPSSALNLSSYIPSIRNVALQLVHTLTDSPSGFGPPCSDRQAWTKKAKVSAWAGFIAELRANSSTLKPFDNNAYLAYVKNGSRVSDRLQKDRIGYLSDLVQAECILWDGQFLGRISDALLSISTQPSWSYSAHDSNLTYYKGTLYFVELLGAAYAPVLAQTLYLLGPLISSSIKQVVRNSIETRFLSPTRLAYNLTASQFVNGNNWWVNSKNPNNWNAACLAGVTSTALTLLEDKNDRALFIAGQLAYSAYFDTFFSDGYNTEGVGYWNYAVQSSIRSREIVLHATQGKIDIFNSSKVAKAISYGLSFPMTSSQRPCGTCRGGNANFGDDGSRINTAVLRYMSNVFLPSANFNLTSPIRGDISGQAMTWWPYGGGVRKLNISGVQSLGVYSLRTFFPVAGVLTSRPDSKNTGRGLYLTAKALGNANVMVSGGHSHDDVGSYTINIDGATNLTGDPGAPGGYDANTFTSLRYTMAIFNSYGHPVPLVASHNQTNAAQAQHITGSLVPSFTYSEDGNRSETLTINMTAAYATASSLKSLFRTFVYSRESRVQYISINDTASFSQPLQPFEVALVTLVNWTRYSDGLGGCFRGPDYNALCVNVTSSSPFSLNPRLLRVEANPSKTFTRIAISLICSPNCWIRTLFFKA